MPFPLSRCHPISFLTIGLFCGVAGESRAAGFALGDGVRLTKGEMLLFKGEKFQPATKGQEFTVLKYDPAEHRVFVGYLKEDGALVAVSLPDDVVEASPPNAWADLVRGAEAFRDQRHEEAKRLFARARQDAAQQVLAGTIATTMAAAQTGSAPGLQAMRNLAGQLAKAGLPSLALPLDAGTDRLGQAVPSKLDRDDLGKRATVSQNAFLWSRQAMARHRMVEAAKHLEEGLRAEPAHPEMKRLQAKAKRDNR